MDLSLLGTIVTFTTPSDVVLSVWTGDGFCGQTISIRFCRSGTIFWAVINRIPSSASAAEVRTDFMIWATVRIGSFQRGIGSSSDKKMCPRTDCLLWVHHETLRQSGPPGSYHWLGIKFHHRSTWPSNREAGGLHRWLLHLPMLVMCQ